jgi:protein TonB
MEANKILNADLLDIIFDGKNKSYGAYDLRKTYSSRLRKALLATFIALAVILLGSVLANKVAKSRQDDIDVLDTQMAEIKKDEPAALPPPPPPPVKPPPPPEINQVKFTPPKVVKDEEVIEKVEEIHEDAAISTKTVESENKVQVVQAPIEDKGTVVAEAPRDDDEGKVFNKVEIEAEYPGGASAWTKYLRNNLDANTPVDNGASEGTYTVIVRFIVSRDGSISDVVAETKHGYGMEAEAIKIIKKGPKWTPAQQNGRYVNAYRRQPITFVVQEQ